jgi:hypothetical protein
MSLVRSLVVGATLLAATLGLSITSTLAAAPSPALPQHGMPIEVGSHCFPAGGSGTFSLNQPGGYIALTVSPADPVPQMTNLVLAGVDRATVPGTPGRPNSAVIFYVGAQESCGGALLSELPVAVTLSVYRLGSPQGGLGLARLDGEQWNVIASPVLNDRPVANPYLNREFYSDPPLNDGVVSTTIQQTGTYAAYQRR